METAIFLLFAFLAVLSAGVVVMHRNPVYSTMSLVVTLVSLAALFVLLGAPFIAALQVLIYTGAILVLFLFVIMLLNVQDEELPWPSLKSIQAWAAGFAAVVFGGMVFLLSYNGLARAELDPLTPELVSLKALATELFGAYLLPFEIVGLLLLVAVIAATVLARKPEAPTSPLREEREP